MRCSFFLCLPDFSEQIGGFHDAAGLIEAEVEAMEHEDGVESLTESADDEYDKDDSAKEDDEAEMI